MLHIIIYDPIYYIKPSLLNFRLAIAQNNLHQEPVKAKPKTLHSIISNYSIISQVLTR